MYLNRLTGYKGKKHLRGADEVIEYTEEQEDELAKCADPITGPIYFIINYMKVTHVDHGFIPFDLWDWQQELLNVCNLNRYVIVKVGRQSGKSVCMLAYLLWYVLFNEDKAVAILANKAATARELMGRLQKSFEALPKWLQQGVKEWNKGSLELANGSKVYADATSGSAIRGKSMNIVMLDEFAHVEAHKAEEFFNSTMPTISSGKTTKVFITSTPKGMNMFHKIWVDATKNVDPITKAGKNGYIAIEIHWWQVPGRDEQWMKEQIALTSQMQFDQEFGCEFLGSALTLINGPKLRLLSWNDPLEYKEDRKALRIYERPQPGHVYTITCDVATGQGGDQQAFNIIDVTDFPFRQVGVFNDNQLYYVQYPDLIYRVARWYNDAFVLIEINDVGQAVSYMMQTEIGYDNLIKIKPKGKQGQQVSGGFQKMVQFGLKSTTATKRIGCASLKSLIETDKLIIQDHPTILELFTFVEDNDSYAADEGAEGAHDDICMSLVLFGWLADQQFFKDAVGKNMRQMIVAEMTKIMDEDFVPFGFIDDGLFHTPENTVDAVGWGIPDDDENNSQIYNPWA